MFGYLYNFYDSPEAHVSKETHKIPMSKVFGKKLKTSMPWQKVHLNSFARSFGSRWQQIKTGENWAGPLIFTFSREAMATFILTTNSYRLYFYFNHLLLLIGVFSTRIQFLFLYILSQSYKKQILFKKLSS